MLQSVQLSSKGLKNKLTCPQCSKEHEEMECKNSQKKCINGKRTNIKLKLALDDNHKSRNEQCDGYQQKLKMERQKTNY